MNLQCAPFWQSDHDKCRVILIQYESRLIQSSLSSSSPTPPHANEITKPVNRRGRVSCDILLMWTSRQWLFNPGQLLEFREIMSLSVEAGLLAEPANFKLGSTVMMDHFLSGYITMASNAAHLTCSRSGNGLLGFALLELKPARNHVQILRQVPGRTNPA